MTMQSILDFFRPSEQRAVPKVEPAPMLAAPSLQAPQMTQEDIDRYGEAAQAAQRLAEEANNRLQTYHIQDKTTMNHIFENPKTSVAGVIGAVPLFSIAVSSFIAGDIGTGIAHAIVGLAVLVGFLQASDGDRIAKTLSSIIPKVEKPQSPPATLLVVVFLAGMAAFAPAAKAQNMVLPTSFQQNGTTITVVIDSRYCDSINAYGCFDMRNKCIRLNDNDASTVAISQTFFHELLHCALHHASYHKLNRNELFVERVSRYLHEAMGTMKYEQKLLSSNDSH